MISSCELGAFESSSSLVWTASPVTVPSSLWAPRGFWHMFPAPGKMQGEAPGCEGAGEQKAPPPPSIFSYSQRPSIRSSLGRVGCGLTQSFSARVPC